VFPSAYLLAGRRKAHLRLQEEPVGRRSSGRPEQLPAARAKCDAAVVKSARRCWWQFKLDRWVAVSDVDLDVARSGNAPAAGHDTGDAFGATANLDVVRLASPSASPSARMPSERPSNQISPLESWTFRQLDWPTKPKTNGEFG